VSLHPSSIEVGTVYRDTLNTLTPQVTMWVPAGTWWQQWRGAVLLPLSSSSFSMSLFSLLLREDECREMRVLVGKGFNGFDPP